MIEKLLKAKFNNIFSLQAITSSKIIHYQNDFNASCNAYKQLSNDVLHNNTRPIHCVDTKSVKARYALRDDFHGKWRWVLHRK